MFKQGDKVVWNVDKEKAEVQFGPFKANDGREGDAYLVKWLEGSSEGFSDVLSARDLTPAPRFKVGQKVTFAYSAYGEVYEIVSGPYPTSDRSVGFWVIKDGDGIHDTSYGKHMIPVVE